MKTFLNILFALCLTIGVVGRFWGGHINKEANDDHAQVVQRILADQSIEHRDSCWECFQPPIFYKANAFISNLRNKTDRLSILKQMQFENVLFSLLAIYFLFLLLKHERIPSQLRYLITCFWLVNPALFGIGIQSTNDTIIIFLGVVTTYYIIRYISKPKLKYALIAIAVLSFAPHIKGSGIALFILGAVTLIPVLLRAKKHRYLLVVIALSGYALVFHSHYTKNHGKYGNAFAINQSKAGKPPLFDDGQEFWKRPGITSVWSGYFKMQYRSLIDTPYNINNGNDYPIHRTSFWGQMYGSFYHAQFLFHPWSWTSKHPDLINLARSIFVLGLLPLLLFLAGLFSELFKFFKNLRFDEKTLTRLVHFGFAFGFLAFNIKYSYDYRDFGCIKSIFMLPAILSLTYFFRTGLELPLFKRIKKPIIISLGVLVLLCAANVVFLLTHLSKPYFAAL